MRNKRSTSIFIAALCAIAVTAAGDTPAKSRDYSAIPLALSNFSYGGVAREHYIAGVFGVFRQLDKNADGLTEAEIAAVDEVERARRSAMALTMIYLYDLNNDGKVERTEVETVAKHRAGSEENTEVRPQVDEVMTADLNGDNVIEFREARGHNSRLIGGAMTAGRGRELLSLDPNKDGRLTAQELEALARASFATVDLNNNGVVSFDEYSAFDQATREARNAYQSAASFRCSMAKPTAAHRFVVLSVGDSNSIPSVSLAGPDAVTTITRVDIEPGKEPLHLLLASSSTPRIWQLRGATNRVAHVALATGEPVVGVAGVARDRVTFLPRNDCALPPQRPTQTLRAVVGRAPDTVVVHSTAETVALPSGMVKPRLKGMTSTDRAASMIERAALRIPDVVRLDPKAVVARGPVTPYDVLPREAGLHQLLQSGALTFIGEPHQRKLKIVKPVARLPAGSHSVTFLLAIGVPIPAGDVRVELECMKIDPAIGKPRC